MRFNRIMIFGLPGAGKSTFALKLGQLLNIPVFHLDRYFFKEGWKERDYQEFLEIQKKLVNQEQWIIEGNATRSLEMRYARADVVIYFHYSRILCLWRLVKRAFFPGACMQDVPEGAAKNIRWRLITYMWGFDTRFARDIEMLRQKYPSAKMYVFSRDQDAENFLRSLKEALSRRKN